MSRSFNPYQIWLGLGESVADPNHFELLGLDEAEDNARTIAAAADRAASRVRGRRPGEQAAEWAALLDRISAAKKCLTDSRLRSEYLKSLRGVQPQDPVFPEGASKPAIPVTAHVDPNMYPPGRAPVSAPPTPVVVRQTPASAPQTPVAARTASVVPPKAPAVAPPQPVFTPLPVAVDAPVFLPMVPTAESLTMSPAGVPYLQPADSADLADPMRPAVPDAAQFSPMAPVPMPPIPMAPVPEYATAMAAAPDAAFPMEAIPMAIPFAAGSVPIAHALPVGTNAFAMPSPAASILEPPRVQPPTESWLENKTSADILDAQQSQGRFLGPVWMCLSAVILLVSLGAGYLYWKSTQDESDPGPVVAGNSDPESATVAENQDRPSPDAQPETGSNVPPLTAILPPRPGADTSTNSKQPNPVESQADKSTTAKTTDSAPATDTPPPVTVPPTTTQPPPKPETKPASDSKTTPTTPATTPATTVPAKTDELPKLTTEELTKLGRAMQKARDAIGEHNFDRAEAFISAASDMPRLPEHQAMLDRLKLLSTSVSQYRKAIQESIGKLEVGATFEVGEAMVVVVETGPEKLILRIGAQNKTYVLREMPVGLAAALASQTLAPDDPNTMALKGAYVLVSPRASAADLGKAREFLEKAAGSIDAAKELLLLLNDKYDLTKKP